MESLHPNDKLAALDWAISQARSVESKNAWVNQTILPVLQQMWDEAQREFCNDKQSK